MSWNVSCQSSKLLSRFWGESNGSMVEGWTRRATRNNRGNFLLDVGSSLTLIRHGGVAAIIHVRGRQIVALSVLKPLPSAVIREFWAHLWVSRNLGSMAWFRNVLGYGLVVTCDWGGCVSYWWSSCRMGEFVLWSTCRKPVLLLWDQKPKIWWKSPGSCGTRWGDVLRACQ